MIRGRVQGVGYRPFVYRLAERSGLAGWVRNRTDGVDIYAEGPAAALEIFVTDLCSRAPPLARIDAIEVSRQPPRGGCGFEIRPSEAEQPASGLSIAADLGTCEECLRELADTADRRHRYPFVACTGCGPRLTVLEDTPFDRERTTMARFGMCAACHAEYDDPRDRRFHAQLIACPACGPSMALRDADGVQCSGDPIATAGAALRAGRIIAVKGLGGYHLACDARRHESVVELRRRKHREAQPFAVMVRDIDEAAALVELTPAERDLLSSPRRPIVLARARAGAGLSPAVAPATRVLGVMLPYTPLHELLLGAAGAPLVMTSGNRTSEPIACDEADALARLSGVADLFLTHDRPIRLRCDDSVARVVAGEPTLLRRSRGFVPEPLPLPIGCAEPTLALGGQLKVTFGLARGGEAFIGPHAGDLDDYAALRAYRDAIAHFERLLAIEPRVLVCDMHPDYASTRYAEERARASGITVIKVQHHHAHVASCMAEHGLDEPVLGVAFDGTGFGLDGSIWGGEFLVGDLRSFRRAAHLRPVMMPGADRAVREPWRMAVAHLHDAGAVELAERLLGVPAASLRLVGQMIERRVQAPLTSSMGRLFDAVAALCRVRLEATYEGQAAIELEALAGALDARGYPFRLEDGDPIVVDTRPLIRAAADDIVADPGAAAVVSRRFHAAVVEIIEAVCVRLRARTRLNAVALSGGVFGNILVSDAAASRLGAAGFRVYSQRSVPCNDGGLSLGQLAVAAALGRPRREE